MVDLKQQLFSLQLSEVYYRISQGLENLLKFWREKIMAVKIQVHDQPKSKSSASPKTAQVQEHVKIQCMLKHIINTSAKASKSSCINTVQ